MPKKVENAAGIRLSARRTTYGQLTRSAHQRLFRLKERIPARYEDVSGADLSARVMQMASQVHLALAAVIRARSSLIRFASSMNTSFGRVVAYLASKWIGWAAARR